MKTKTHLESMHPSTYGGLRLVRSVPTEASTLFDQESEEFDTLVSFTNATLTMTKRTTRKRFSELFMEAMRDLADCF